MGVLIFFSGRIIKTRKGAILRFIIMAVFNGPFKNVIESSVIWEIFDQGCTRWMLPKRLGCYPKCAG